MADDRSRRRITVHTDIHDVRTLTDTGAIPIMRTRAEQPEGKPVERQRPAPGAPR